MIIALLIGGALLIDKIHGAFPPGSDWIGSRIWVDRLVKSPVSHPLPVPIPCMQINSAQEHGVPLLHIHVRGRIGYVNVWMCCSRCCVALSLSSTHTHTHTPNIHTPHPHRAAKLPDDQVQRKHNPHDAPNGRNNGPRHRARPPHPRALGGPVEGGWVCSCSRPFCCLFSLRSSRCSFKFTLSSSLSCSQKR